MATILANRIVEVPPGRLLLRERAGRVSDVSNVTCSASVVELKCRNLLSIQREVKAWERGGLRPQKSSWKTDVCHRCLACLGTKRFHCPIAMATLPSVVVTREQGKNEKLIAALSSRGVSCLEVPLIEHKEGRDRDLLPRLLQDETFEWIIVTSPEAASVFLEGWREAGSPCVRLAVVGAGTGQMFENCPEEIHIEFTPSKATAKVLASEIPHLEGTSGKVLYPASAKASNDLETGLQERGFVVTRINTYSTETVDSLDLDLMERAASLPVVTFASPSSVRAWMDLVAKKTNWNGATACIGSTSAEAARKAGLTKIFYPDSPGIDGWVVSIMEALEAETKSFVASTT